MLRLSEAHAQCLEPSTRRTATRKSRNRFAVGVSANRSSDVTPPRDSAECTTCPAPDHSATCEMRWPSAKHSTSPASYPPPVVESGTSWPAVDCMSLSRGNPTPRAARSEEHTSELQSRLHLVCRLLLEKKKTNRPELIHPNHSL